MPAAKEVYIGVDIGGTNVRAALIGADNSIYQRFRSKTLSGAGNVGFVTRLTEQLQALAADAAGKDLKLCGVGVGIPGLIAGDGTVRSSVNLRFLEGVNLSQQLSDSLHVPVVSCNDANLIALGEAAVGAGVGFRSLAVITIGTGLGSGLILDGKLWRGDHGFAAEFGHITVDPEGLPCPCGNRGCLEQYVSASALSRLGGGETPEQLAEQARLGNQVAIAAFERVGYWLGTALAGLVNTLNLSGIVIGGGVSAGFDLFEPSLRRAVQERAFVQMVQELKLVRAGLGDDAGLLGGALLASGRYASER